MKILLYGLNYSPEITGIGKYTGEMGAWLATRKHEVKAIAAPPYYPAWALNSGYENRYGSEVIDGVTVFRSPLFVPRQPRTLSRMLHLLSFAATSSLLLLRLLRWRPHVIFVVEPTLFCLPGALLYSWITGAKVILHVQDYEVDALFGLGLMKSWLAAGVARRVESWCMRHVDVVSTISHSMMRTAEVKGVAKGKLFFFPNWVDTDFISPRPDKTVVRLRWGILPDQKVVLYSGNMGKKQGLDLVVDAANAFRHRPDVLFLMVGDGVVQAELETRARALELTNVRFESFQPFEQLPELLAIADVHLVVQKKGAADAVMPSKLTGILSVGGHALITAEAGTELGRLVQEFPGIATCVEPESLDAFCLGLDAVISRNTNAVNTIAREYALTFLNQTAVLGRFEAQLKDLAGGNSE
jgi:colanic acid biosynthesis glycosyl transferase WcaI